MHIIKTLNILYETVKNFKENKKNIGLIPTMGNLHDGHIALISLSKKYVDIIIVSIFVNPMQFNNRLDLKKYPNTLKKDLEILQLNNVNIVFIPKTHEMYPNGIKHQTFVDVPKLSKILEGQSRPGHFKGVTTIVSKLFNIIQPNFAFFGEKDYQQLLIVKTLVKELNYIIRIISLPTVRLKNGLAFSSRNSHLNTKQMKIAPYLYKIITLTTKEIKMNDGKNTQKIINKYSLLLIKKGFSIDIFNIYDTKKLMLPSSKSKKLIILASVFLGDNRLIDNEIFLLD